MANLLLYHQMREKIKLSDLQKHVLIGTILGDGHLSQTYSRNNFRLQVAHGSAQKEYVWWKYQIFRNLVLTEPKYQQVNDSWRFRTISHPEITALAGEFYENGKKIIPVTIDELLVEPIALAVWFMDDGAFHRQNAYTISSHCFSMDENIRLKECVRKNFGFEISILNDGKGNRIYIPSRSGEHFRDLILEYVLPGLRYKLLKPRRDYTLTPAKQPVPQRIAG